MKRSPPPLRERRRSQRPMPKCKTDWSAERRLTHYIRADPLSGCHIWHGSRIRGGYGNIEIHGQQWLTHRLAWTLKHGPIPAGMMICHRCDERRCCNTDHLFLGTRGDNMADLKTKRAARGEARASGGGTIRIIYRGVELVGEVKVVAVDPRVKAVQESSR